MVDALKFARISSASSVCDDSRGQAATSVLEHFEVGGEGAGGAPDVGELCGPGLRLGGLALRGAVGDVGCDGHGRLAGAAGGGVGFLKKKC